MNEQDDSSDEEVTDVYARHGEAIDSEAHGEEEIPQDDKLFENYFNFDDEDYMVSERKAGFPLADFYAQSDFFLLSKPY